MPVEQGAQQLLFVFYKMKSLKIQQQTNFKWVVENILIGGILSLAPVYK